MCIRDSTNADHIFYSTRKVANVGYSSVTGISTITTQTDHGLSSGDEVTLSGIAFTCDYSPRIGIHTAVYDNISGIMTVTTAVGHGLSTSGQKSVVIFTGLALLVDLMLEHLLTTIHEDKTLHIILQLRLLRMVLRKL